MYVSSPYGVEVSQDFVDPACPVDWSHHLNRGLVGRWKVIPNSGWRGGNKLCNLAKGSDGIVTGTFPWDTTKFEGGFGSLYSPGVYFVNNYINIPTSPKLAAFSQSTIFSVSIWVKIKTSQVAIITAQVLSQVSPFPNDDTGWLLITRTSGADSTIDFTCSTGGWLGASGTLVNNRWYHVLAGYDGSNAKIYVNGVETKSGTMGRNLASDSTISADIGRFHSGVPGIDGFVDDACFYTRAPTASFAQALYQEQRRGSPETLRWVGAKTYFFPVATPATTTTAYGGSKSTELVDPACPLDWSHPLNRGLVGCWTTLPNPGWSGGLKLRDITRKGNDGTLTNFASPFTQTSGWVPGRNQGRKALAFETDDTVLTTLSPNIEVWTISLWMKADSFSTFIGWVTAGVNSIELSNQSGGVGYSFFGIGRPGYYNPVGLSNTSLSTGVWYHLTVTMDAAKDCRLYLNGKLDSSVLSYSGKDVILGESGGAIAISGTNNGRSYAGKIEDVRIYNRALSTAEVQALYQEQLRGSPETLNWVKSKSYPIFTPDQAADGSDDIYNRMCISVP